MGTQLKLYEELIYKEDKYILLVSEKNRVFSPNIFALDKLWNNSQEQNYFGTYVVDQYKFLLQSVIIPYNESYPTIRGVVPVKWKDDLTDEEYLEYENLSESLGYSGGIIIAKDLIWPYEKDEICPCYCYKNIMELIFVEGTLVTTIDHSKAMVRIRKNIEKGLRDIYNLKDAICIMRFIKTSFVCNYSHSFRRHKIKQWKKGKFYSFLSRNKH